MAKAPIDQVVLFLKERFVTIFKWVKEHKLKTLLLLISFAIALMILFILAIYFGAFGALPTANELQSIENPQATTIYSGDNKVLDYYYTENRSNMILEELSDEVKYALIATEDVRFYEHSGVDYRSLMRVLFKTILFRDRNSGGGSTITQQLAKNVFGRSNRYPMAIAVNKIREMFIASRLEDVYSKDEIIILYLNTIPFGDQIFGLEKAAKRYFNKNPQELAVEEAATLIGLLKATTYYNPKKNPKNSLKRRNVVLSQMLKYGYLTKEDYEKSIQDSIRLTYGEDKKPVGEIAHFKNYLRNEFNDWASEHPKDDGSLWDIDEDGLTIYTTVHSGMQRLANKSIERNMNRLQESFKNDWAVVGGKDKFIQNKIDAHPLSKKLKAQGVPQDSISTFFSSKTTRRLYNGQEVVSGLYSIRDSIIMAETVLQGAVCLMHSGSGKIMAYVGGRDYGYSQYDNLVLPKPVGSTFKPFVYLTALLKGSDPCRFYDNELRTYSSYKDWTPRNSSGEYGGSYSLFGALAHSVNTISVQVLFESGIKDVIRTAKALGLSGKIPELPSITLGTVEATPLEVISTYGTISNGGRVYEPYCIKRIVDQSGQVLFEKEIPAGQDSGISKKAIEQLQLMMQFTNIIGTGRSIQSYGIDANLIAKTGTTQNNADGWYIAASPEIVCGAWVGTMNPSINFKSTRLGSGGATALPIVGSILAPISKWSGGNILTNFPEARDSIFCAAKTELNAEDANRFQDRREEDDPRFIKFLNRLFN